MSKGLLASIVALLAGAGVALAQAPVPPNGPLPPNGMGGYPPMLSAEPVDGSMMANGCRTDCPNDCCPWYGRAEYLLWWTKGSPLSAPLVTSVAPGTPAGGSPIPGAIGGAGTTVAIGGSDVDLGTRQGGRFTLGRWFDPEQTAAFEGSYFFLGTHNEGQSVNSLGGLAAPTFMIPFVDVTGSFTGGTPGNSALLPALGQLFNVTGGLTGPFVSHDAMSLHSATQGADAYGVFNIGRNGRLRVDWMFGFRWLNLEEDLNFSTQNQTTAQAPEFIVFNASDTISANNNFYGGLLGLRAEYAPDDGRGGWRGGFCYRAAFLLALGDTVERINIDGQTQTNLGNPPLAGNANYAGGVFSSLTNQGGHDVNHFAVVPEVDLSLGYAFTSWGRVSVGYNFLYISDVARPGNQIDPGLNVFRSALVQSAQPPIAAPAIDPARPAFNAVQSSFWAQGLTLGLEFRR